MTDTNNPPAFPRVYSEAIIQGVRREYHAQEGLTMRDYFAAHAPVTMEDVKNSLIADGFEEPTYELWFRRCSQMRYIYADCMLVARTRES